MTCASILALLVVTGRAGGQIVTLGPPPPKTALEAFELQEGATIVHGLSRIGEVVGPQGGAVVVIAREMTNAVTGRKARGVTIEVHERDSTPRYSTSYIDYDELAGLIQGLEQLGRLNRSSTQLDQFGGDYRTKGHFRVAVRGFRSDISVALSSGLVDPTSATFKATDLGKIRDLLVAAVVKLDALGAPGTTPPD